MAKTTTSHLGIETKAEFARRLGVHKSTVTRYAQADRLVLATNGKVMVKDSLARIYATMGHRTDLTEKHAQDRGQAIKNPTDEQGQSQSDSHDSMDPIDLDMDATEQTVGQDRAKYKAAAIDFGNQKIKLEEALNEGIRIDKQDYHQHISQKAVNLKSAIERLIDNLAPQIATLTDETSRKAKIESEIQLLLQQIN